MKSNFLNQLFSGALIFLCCAFGAHAQQRFGGGGGFGGGGFGGFGGFGGGGAAIILTGEEPVLPAANTTTTARWAMPPFPWTP